MYFGLIIAKVQKLTMKMLLFFKHYLISMEYFKRLFFNFVVIFLIKSSMISLYENIDEEKEVCQNQSKWKALVSAVYKTREVYVCNPSSHNEFTTLDTLLNFSNSYIPVL